MYLYIFVCTYVYVYTTWNKVQSPSTIGTTTNVSFVFSATIIVKFLHVFVCQLVHIFPF